MSLYMITSAHEPEECLDALDEIAAKKPDTLKKFVFGCAGGDHTGYAILEAESRIKAMELLPESLWESACISKVDRLTPADIQAFHAKAA